MRVSRRTWKAARRLFRDCLVGGQLDEERVRQVVLTAIGSGRHVRFDVLSQLARLVRLDREKHTSRVESAVPLPGDLQTAITADLTRRRGHGLQIVFAHEPTLIGGLRITVGSDVYDGSIRARLAELEKCF